MFVSKMLLINIFPSVAVQILIEQWCFVAFSVGMGFCILKFFFSALGMWKVSLIEETCLCIMVSNELCSSPL